VFIERRRGKSRLWDSGRSGFCRRSAVEDQCYNFFQRSITAANLDVCHRGDASQTGMGGKTEFSGLGLLRMRMGVHRFRAGHWPIDWRDEGALRTAARQRVHLSCLCRTPQSHKKSSLANSTLCDSDIHAKLPFSEDCRSGNQGFSDKRHTNGQMAKLENSQ
jgi:hypothetical protein